MFYDRFVELCKDRGMSPAAVTRELGLNNSSSTAWKRGSIPKGDTLQKLADYFGVPIDYLLAETWGIKAGGEIKAGGGIKSRYGIEAGGNIKAGGPIEVGPCIYGEQARANKAMDQMTEEGQSKVADYAEDILPRYRATPLQQPASPTSGGSDTTPAEPGPESPEKGK